MTLYTLIDLMIVSAPLALSFDRRVRFIRRWPRVLVAALAAGAPFVAWDHLAALSGDWSFNPAYAGGARIGALPVGELLFFFVVPFAALFVYEVIRAYLPERFLSYPRAIPIAVATASLAAIAFVPDHAYTRAVLLAFAAACLVAAALHRPLFARRSVIVFLAAMFVPFAAANGVLTALPIVTYAESAIIGARVGSIPIEDFLYNFAYATILLAAYELTGRTAERISARRKIAPLAARGSDG